MIKSITRKEFARHERMIREALRLSSHHDPDLVRELKDHARWLVQLGTELGNRLDVVEHQLQRLGAPQYRTVRKGTRR